MRLLAFIRDRTSCDRAVRPTARKFDLPNVVEWNVGEQLVHPQLELPILCRFCERPRAHSRRVADSSKGIDSAESLGALKEAEVGDVIGRWAKPAAPHLRSDTRLQRATHR